MTTLTLVGTPDPDNHTEAVFRVNASHFGGDQILFKHFLDTMSKAWADDDQVIITYGANQFATRFALRIKD